MFGFKKIKQGKIATDALEKASAIAQNLKYNDVDFDEKVITIREHCQVAMEHAKYTGDITQKYVYDSLTLVYKMIDNQADLLHKIQSSQFADYYLKSRE